MILSEHSKSWPITQPTFLVLSNFDNLFGFLRRSASRCPPALHPLGHKYFIADSAVVMPTYSKTFLFQDPSLDQVRPSMQTQICKNFHRPPAVKTDSITRSDIKYWAIIYANDHKDHRPGIFHRQHSYQQCYHAYHLIFKYQEDSSLLRRDGYRSASAMSGSPSITNGIIIGSRSPSTCLRHSIPVVSAALTRLLIYHHQRRNWNTIFPWAVIILVSSNWNCLTT